MPSKTRDRQRRPARSQRPLPPGKSLLVVCEGTTEQEYIDELSRHIGNPSVQIRFCRDRGSPDKIIELAQHEIRDQAANRNPRFDEVWCVFDRDSHDYFNGAIQTAIDRGYKLAVSNPCIELWLLVHHRQSPGQRHRDDVHDMLKRHDKGYKKHVRFERYVNGIPSAVQIAHRMEVIANEDGERPFGNPSTSFYKLLISIASRAGSDEYIQGWDWLAQYATIP
jgi:hypothetical protein